MPTRPGSRCSREIHSFSSRLQLRVIAGAAMFFAIWAGIVLLAIVLPPAPARAGALAAVVGVFVLGAVIAMLVAAKRKCRSARWAPWRGSSTA